MKAGLNNKPFVLAFSTFVVLLAITITAALLIRGFMVDWLHKSSQEIADGTVFLVESRFNSYKLRQYGLMETLKEIHRGNPDLLVAIHKNPKVRDMYGNVRELKLSQDVNEYPQALTAFNEGRPVSFSVSGDEGKQYLASIIPVDKFSGLFVYLDLDYSDLFLPVNKTRLLEGNNHLGLRVFSVDDNQNPVFVSEDFQNKVTIKRSSDSPEIVRKINLDLVKLEYQFSEIHSSQLFLMVRHIPFTLVVVGTVISIMAFGMIYIGAIYYEKDITTKLNNGKEQSEESA